MRLARLALLAPALVIAACEPIDQGGGAGVGGRIAFVRDGALVTSLDSGDGELIITEPGTAAAPALTSNGQSVVFAYSASKSDDARGLYRVASSGGTPVAIAEPASGTGFGEPSISRDGQTIAFVATTGGDSEVWTVPASGGTPQPVAGGHKDLHFPAWIGAGKLLVSKGGSLSLQTLDLATGELTELGQTSMSRGAVSPDGTKIAYAKGSPNAIHVRDLATGAETPLASTGRGDVNPAFSPDGTLVAFDSKGAGETLPKVYAVRVDGTPGLQLLQTGNSASWSP